MIANGNTYCKIASFGPVLPTEYQEVEYIESTGTQYIDTNKTLTTTTSLTANVAFTNNTVLSQVNGLWGGPNKNYRLQFGINNGSYFWIGIGDKNYTTTTHIDTNKHTFDIDLLNKKYGIDGNLISVGLILTSDVTNNIYLFAFNHVNNGTPYYYCYQKVYSCKLYDNNILVRNFIPCYRKSDNEIGMYDTVNKVFYTNQGTGTFLKGNNVVHTIRYKIPTEERPYISGHVTDGSSTFTFTVNINQSVTVPVDNNGNWKWVVDRAVTSLANAFFYNKTIDSVVVYGLNDIESMNQLCGKYVSGSTQTSSIRSFVFKNCDLSKCTKMQYAFTNCTNFEEFIYPDSLQPSNVLYGYLDRTKIDSIKASFFTRLGNWNALLTNNTYVKELDLTLCENPTSMNYSFQNVETIYLNMLPSTFNPNNGNYSFKRLKNLSINALEVDLSFKYCQSLTEQSVVNLFNAVAADGITLTFHQNVWNMIMREIDVQGSPIQVAYQNMIDNYDVTIANASFDAEIEYLKGDGNAYIKTNDLFKINTTIKIIVTNSDVLHENRYHIVGTFKGGARYRISTMNSSATYYWYGASSYANAGDLSTTKTTYVITYNSLKKYQNNSIVKDLSFETEYVSNNVPISMFFCDEVGDFYEHFLGEIYACQIYEDDTLVRDFIPVRKGTTGYLYDKISGNLFGNSGTGDFVLGNDK